MDLNCFIQCYGILGGIIYVHFNNISGILRLVINTEELPPPKSYSNFIILMRVFCISKDA